VCNNEVMETKTKWKKGVFGYYCEEMTSIYIYKDANSVGGGFTWTLVMSGINEGFNTLTEAKKRAGELINKNKAKG